MAGQSEKCEHQQGPDILPPSGSQASYNTGYYETNKDANDKIIAFGDQINNNQRQFLGATLTIPLFNKNSVRFDVQSAKIAAEQAQTRLTIARQTLLYEMEEITMD